MLVLYRSSTGNCEQQEENLHFLARSFHIFIDDPRNASHLRNLLDNTPVMSAPGFSYMNKKTILLCLISIISVCKYHPCCSWSFASICHPLSFSSTVHISVSSNAGSLSFSSIVCTSTPQIGNVIY